MSIDMDVNMVAVVGRCPLAQVLRNSLSVHPPTTGTKRCHETEPLSQLCYVYLFQVNITIVFRTTWRNYLRAILSLLQSQQSPQLSVLSSQQWCPHLTPSLSSFAQSHKLFFLLLS